MFGARSARPASVRQRGACLLGQRAEGGGVVNRQVRQHLAVHLDAGLVQAVHEHAVRQAALACTGVDAHDPQRAELALALTAVAVGVLTGLDDGLIGDAEHTAAGTVVTLGLVQDLLVAGVGDDAAFDSWHGLGLVKTARSGVRQHLAHGRRVGRAHQRGAIQAPLTLGALLGEDVAQVRVAALERPRAGFLEPLGGAAVGFQLGHG